jgi:hypothetical protein
VIRRPRLYEIIAASHFGGLRRIHYDGLVELSAAKSSSRSSIQQWLTAIWPPPAGKVAAGSRF